MAKHETGGHIRLDMYRSAARGYGMVADACRIGEQVSRSLGHHAAADKSASTMRHFDRRRRLAEARAAQIEAMLPPPDEDEEDDRPRHERLGVDDALIYGED